MDKKKSVKIDLLAVLLAILFGIVIAFILILLTKNNPFLAFKYLFKGAIGTGNGKIFKLVKIGNVLLEATPLILAGLAVAFSFRTGLFNIGVSGQMLFAASLCLYVGTQFEMPKYIHVLVLILVAIIGGALFAFIPAILKSKLNINEVVTTIMMNYISVEIVSFFIKSTMKHPEYDSESIRILSSGSLRVDFFKSIFSYSNINLGFFIAIIAVIFYMFILNKTTFGFELKAVGLNKNAAFYSGIKVNRNILASLMISGALAGLAGYSYYMGNTDHIPIGVLPTYGFEGIVVSLLGLNNGIGIILSSIFLAFFKVGQGAIKANLVNNIPNQLVPIIIAVIIYFVGALYLFKRMVIKLMSYKKKSIKEGGIK